MQLHAAIIVVELDLQGHTLMEVSRLLTSVLLMSLMVFPQSGRVTAADVITYHTKLHDQVGDRPAKGMLLIAGRGMPDLRFRQTVILLANHDEAGSLGLILNRASTTKLGHLIPKLSDMDQQGHKVYFGGPVGIDSLKFLVRSPHPFENTLHIIDDLYLGGSRATLENILRKNKPTSEFRIYLGYAGWGPEQLDGELDRRDWHLRKAKLEEIFNRREDTIWHKLIEIYEPEGQLVDQHRIPAWAFAAPLTAAHPASLAGTGITLLHDDAILHHAEGPGLALHGQTVHRADSPLDYQLYPAYPWRAPLAGESATGTGAFPLFGLIPGTLNRGHPWPLTVLKNVSLAFYLDFDHSL